jgi:AAA-like domain
VRLPARFVTGNLVWSRSGAVWALYRVEPVCYPYLSRKEKLAVHGRLRAALMALPAESSILSICRVVDPGAVVTRMVQGVDLGRHGAWREVTEATLEGLGGTPVYERTFYLAVRLPEEGAREGLRSVLGSAAAQVADGFGLPPTPVRQREIESRERQAGQLEARLRGSLCLSPATGAEIRWIYAQASRRGLAEPVAGEGLTAPEDGRERRAAGALMTSLGEAVFYEGGSGEDRDRPKTHRRYLRIEAPAGVSYQAFLAFADMPSRFVFPGGAGEWFFHTDEAPFPVDWCARIRAVPNQEAQVRARRQARQLVGQVEEYEGEPSGVPKDLHTAWEGVDDERAMLAANPADPELQVTVILCVYADNLLEIEARAAQLQAMYQPNEYMLARPTGGQLGLYEAMLPGSAPPRVVRDYTQYVLPRDLAAGMPFACSDVGDPGGMLLGVTLDGGTFRPVLFDPAYGPAVNRSGSLGAFGALGAGKSYFIKAVAFATLARGGQVIAMDRTPAGEYVAFSGIAPGRSQVVRLAAGSGVCLDPLRVFAGTARVRYAVGFLSLLTGTSPSDLQGAALAEAVRDAAARPDPRLGHVLDALERVAAEDADARVVFRKLSNFARNDLADLVFGDGELLGLDADYIVFHAPGIDLPDKEVLLSEHLARQLLPEQLFSLALLYLVAAVAREVTFRDPSRFAAALFDEAWALTSSMQGRQLLLDGVRDGRKHNAAVWLLSQHPSDLGDDALVHLLGNRFAFRQSRGAGAAALRFLGVEPEEELVQMVESRLEEGQCLFRDVRDRVGLIQVLEAITPELREAFETNPSRFLARQQQPEDAGDGRSTAEPPTTEVASSNGHRAALWDREVRFG